MDSNIYSTKIVHQRFYPFKHKFNYSLLSMCINYDELDILSKKLKIFSHNKFNIFSFYDKDHGYRDERTLKDFVRNLLEKKNFNSKDLCIKIVCFPRIFGYVFNPLSIIYCYKKLKLIAIFYEVKNTSNEQHTYYFMNLENKESTEYKHQCKKIFYVSPFIQMKGVYKFYNSFTNNNIAIKIDFYDEKENKILTASQSGQKTNLNSYTLLRQLIFNPVITFKVITGIMYEAFFILIKGGKYYKRQKKIVDTISFEGKL